MRFAVHRDRVPRLCVRVEPKRWVVLGKNARKTALWSGRCRQIDPATSKLSATNTRSPCHTPAHLRERPVALDPDPTPHIGLSRSCHLLMQVLPNRWTCSRWLVRYQIQRLAAVAGRQGRRRAGFAILFPKSPGYMLHGSGRSNEKGNEKVHWACCLAPNSATEQKLHSVAFG